LPSSTSPSHPPSTAETTLEWKQPLLLHQNASKTLATHPTPLGTLIVSGGDDGALAFVLVNVNCELDSTLPSTAGGEQEREVMYAPPP
nr:hypothetical protein [Tanacetum cinerariifolium]